jgi:hypothetical protein
MKVKYFRSCVRKISQKSRSHLKIQAPELWREAISILRNRQKKKVFIRHDYFVPGIYAPLLSVTELKGSGCGLFTGPIPSFICGTYQILEIHPTAIQTTQFPTSREAL